MIERAQCLGCNDDFYNQPGNAGSGDRCWSAESGVMKTRYRIGTWTAPTERKAFAEEQRPSCYRVKGAALYDKLPDFVKAEDVVRRGARP